MCTDMEIVDNVKEKMFKTDTLLAHRNKCNHAMKQQEQRGCAVIK